MDNATNVVFGMSRRAMSKRTRGQGQVCCHINYQRQVNVEGFPGLQTQMYRKRSSSGMPSKEPCLWGPRGLFDLSTPGLHGTTGTMALFLIQSHSLTSNRSLSRQESRAIEQTGCMLSEKLTQPGIPQFRQGFPFQLSARDGTISHAHSPSYHL